MTPFNDQLHELTQIHEDMQRAANASRARWETIRTGAMQTYVLEQLSLAPAEKDLTAEWYPIQPDHPFPCFRREVPDEEVLRLREVLFPGARSLSPTMVREPLHEVRVELDVSDLIPGRGKVLIHPTLFADYLVAFNRTYLVDRLYHGRYLESLRQYDGPGGQLFLRPMVYHGHGQGFSAGEIRCSFG